MAQQAGTRLIGERFAIRRIGVGGQAGQPQHGKNSNCLHRTRACISTLTNRYRPGAKTFHGFCGILRGHDRKLAPSEGPACGDPCFCLRPASRKPSRGGLSELTPFRSADISVGCSTVSAAERPEPTGTAALQSLQCYFTTTRRIVPGGKSTIRERFFSKESIYEWKADSNTETDSQPQR